MYSEGKINYLHFNAAGVLLPPTDFKETVGVFLAEHGEAKIQLGAESVMLACGRVLFVPEGVVAYAASEAEAALTLLTYPVSMLRENMELLDRELFEMFLLQARTRPVILDDGDDIYFRVVDAVRSAETEYLSKETCYGLAMRAQICRLTALFLRRYARQGQATDERLLYHNVARFGEVLSYVQTHLDEKLTVPLLAERVHLSADYFSHLLDSVTSKTATHYLRSVRINAAMRYLLETDMTVSDVARAVGFGTGDYLSRLFRQCTSLTPISFRAMCHGNLRV